MDECLRTATRDLGLDGVELSWHESFQRPHCTRDDLDWLASTAHTRRASPSAHVWNNIAESDPDTVEQELLEWLRLCDRTETRDLVVHGGSFAEQREGIARTRRVLERVLPAFERRNVVLNLENHYAYDYHDCRELFSEPWEFREVLSLESPSLRFCFDTGHGNMTHNTTELLTELAPWLNYVHLADNHGVDDDHTPFGQGTVDWENVLSLLQNLQFDGVCCVEFPVRHDRAPFQACISAIRDRFAVP
jgi:sugar phosphate isomerase/epimerase